ncbi:Subtilisin-like protease 10, partial [Podila epigama]
MRTQLILLVSLAVASLAVAAEVGSPAAQGVLSVPDQKEAPAGAAAGVEAEAGAKDEQQQQHKADNNEDKDEGEVEISVENDPSLEYVYDLSKASTRGYDVDGRQEVVNIGPGLKTTADGQTRSRSGPRGRQRGAVLPHKYIVRLKNGADFETFNIQSKVEEHNRLARVPGPDGKQKLEQEVPNQVSHEYDFGTWKGYAGQFSSEFLKELEKHDDVDYIEEDKMMWAWDMEPEEAAVAHDDIDDSLQEQGDHPLALSPEEVQPQGQIELEAVKPGHASSAKVGTVSTKKKGAFDSEAVINGHYMSINYYSLKAPCWGLSRISERRPNNNDYTYMSTAGYGVDVYIIDSGVYAEHNDFNGRASNVANFVSNERATDLCGH